jgi:hypothetical protein
MAWNKFFEHSYLFRERRNQHNKLVTKVLNEGPKLLKVEAARRSATGSQSAIFANTGGRSKEGNTEKNCRNKED